MVEVIKIPDKVGKQFNNAFEQRLLELEATNLCAKLGGVRIKEYGDEIARVGKRSQVDGVNSPFAKLKPIQIGRYSPAFFGHHYIGDFVFWKHQSTWIDAWSKDYYCYLAPRDHGKTFIFLFLRGLWTICYEESPTILFISRRLAQCQKPFLAIRNALVSNEKILKDFGSLQDPKGRWTDTLIDCKRPSGSVLFDPTLECIGVGGSITGSHPQLICADDVEDDGSTQTTHRLQGTKDWWYGTVMQLCEPETAVTVSGTRKHWADLYQTLIEDKRWYNKIDRAILNFPENWEQRVTYEENEDGVITDVSFQGDWNEWKVLWPDKWGVKRLLLERYDKPIYFDREKQNDPSGMKGRDFQVDWLHYYDSSDLPDNLSIYLGMDLAISQKDRAAYFVICNIGVSKKKAYLLEYYREKLPFPSQVEVAKQHILMHNPVMVGVESVAYQMAMAQQLMHEGFPNIKEVPAKGDKDIRLMTRLAPLFKHGRILIRGERNEDGIFIAHSSMNHFMEEYIHFPHSKTKDILDALYAAIDVSGIDEGMVDFTGYRTMLASSNASRWALKGDSKQTLTENLPRLGLGSSKRINWKKVTG